MCEPSLHMWWEEVIMMGELSTKNGREEVTTMVNLPGVHEWASCTCHSTMHYLRGVF
jgi:hypothetical protein